MNNVSHIEDVKNVWFPAKCLCVNCSHMWEGVIHKDRDARIECPSCHEMKGAAIINYYELKDGLIEE